MKQSNTPIELLEQRAKEFEGASLEERLDGNLSEPDTLAITSQLLQEIQFLHSQNIAFTRSIAPNHFKVDANNKVVATGFEHAQVTDNPEHFKKDILALGVMLKGVLKIENLGNKDANRIVKGMMNPTQEFSLSHAIEGFDRLQQQFIRKRHNIDSIIHHSLDELYDLAEGNTEFKKGLEDEAAQQFKIIEALSKVIEKTAFDDHVSPANKEQIQEELRQRMHSYNDTLIQLEERKISERKINVRIQRKEALLASRLADLTIFTIPSNASKESLKKLDKDLENKLSQSVDENEKVILEEIYENVHSCLEKKSADNLTYHDIKIPLMTKELAYFSDIELHLDEEAPKPFTPSWRVGALSSASSQPSRIPAAAPSTSTPWQSGVVTSSSSQSPKIPSAIPSTSTSPPPWQPGIPTSSSRDMTARPGTEESSSPTSEKRNHLKKK